ncbi:hypothetical protein IW146_004652 [Coemansia sp. RSA 922]|nr:hypothetical protein IW146_004652 [Coemansia sp. RSA 922]KAJ2423435.1 hypothetical protein GGF41_003143 [Coemansia sp. RSA 2531]
MTTELDRLLAQIKSESARSVAGLAPPPPKHTTVYTGVDALDDALREIYETDESSGPLLELLGLAGSGKTHTAYHICATIALNGQSVLFIDIDGKASAHTLAHHIKSRVKSTEQVAEALRLVHIFTPSTTQSLIATLAMLPQYVQRHDLSIGLLVLDGLGCNYWVDRKESVHVRLRSKRATAFFRLQQLFVDTLQMVHRRLGCLTVATSLLLLPVLDSQEDGRVIGNEYRDHMIQRWSSVVSRSFLIDSRADGNALSRVTFTPVGSQKAGLYTAYVDQNGLHTNTG